MSRTEDNLKEYVQITELVKTLEERKKKIRTEVIADVGTDAIIGDYKIYTKTTNKFQLETFKRERPYLYEQYLKESSPVTYITLNK